MLKWEDVPQDNRFYLRRTPIFGGWLVQMISDVNTPFKISVNDGEIYDRQGDEHRTSITFVPDPNHEWDLNTDYTPQKFTYGNR